jgi:hypothetical protein
MQFDTRVHWEGVEGIWIFSTGFGFRVREGSSYMDGLVVVTNCAFLAFSFVGDIPGATNTFGA